MADEKKIKDDFEEDVDSSSSQQKAPRKGIGGFVPEIVVKILKLVFVGVLATAFVVGVSVLTNFLMNKSGRNVASIPMSTEYQGTMEELDWFTLLGEIRTRTSDEDPNTVIVKIALGYTKNDQKLLSELINKTIPLQAKVRRFFSEKSKNDLTADNEQVILDSLRTAINNEISTGVIKSVEIQELNIIEM